MGCWLCGGPEEFGLVTGIAVGAGRVVVADRDAPHLRVFTTGGAFVRTAGPEGDGPGELRFPLAVAVVEAGISVLDMRQGRVTRLDHEGRERGTLRMGRFSLAASFVPGGEDLDVALADFRARQASLVRWEGGFEPKTLRQGLPGLELPQPGEPPLMISLARARDGRLAVGTGSDEYRIVFLDATGAVVRDLIREVPRVPRTEEEMERLAGVQERVRARLDAERGSAGRAAAVDPLRPHFGPDALRFDGEGRLWVRTERGGNDTRFDLFEGSGRYLGELSVPGRVSTFGVGEGLLAAVVLDELDLPTVHLFRVTGAAPPPG